MALCTAYIHDRQNVAQSRSTFQGSVCHMQHACSDLDCVNNTYNVRCTAGWQSHSRDIDIHTKCESVQIGIITVFTTGLMTCTRTPCAYARRNIACRRDGRHVMHYQHIYHVHSLPSLISQLIGPWRRFQTVRYRRSCRYMYEVLSCRNNFIL